MSKERAIKEKEQKIDNRKLGQFWSMRWCWKKMKVVLTASEDNFSNFQVSDSRFPESAAKMDEKSLFSQFGCLRRHQGKQLESHQNELPELTPQSSGS